MGACLILSRSVPCTIRKLPRPSHPSLVGACCSLPHTLYNGSQVPVWTCEEQWAPQPGLQPTYYCCQPEEVAEKCRRLRGSGLKKTQPPNRQDDVIENLNKLVLSQSCKSRCHEPYTMPGRGRQVGMGANASRAQHFLFSAREPGHQCVCLVC